MWAFFWTEEGGEYRFKTHVLKEVDRPAPYLMLDQGDELISSENRKFISCDLDLEGVAEWLPASRFGRSTPSLTLFEKVEDVETLPVRLHELSGSGFAFETDEKIEVGDLVRLKGGSATPDLLEEVAGRAVKVTRSGVRFKFFKLSSEDRDAILHHIVPRMSPDALHKSTNGKSQVPG